MKNSTLIAFLLLIALSACKKDQDPTQIESPNVTKKLVGFTFDNNLYAPISLEYDAQGRVTRYNDGDDDHTIAYNGKEIQIKVVRKSENREVFSFTGTLNAQGNLVSGNGISRYNLNTTKSVAYDFEYDANGYMSRKLQNYNNGESVYDFQYTYQDGNMVGFKVYLDGNYSYGGIWEYDTTQKDRIGLNWDKFDAPNFFTGKPNQNLSTKYTGINPNTPGWFVTFTNTLDADGYPSSRLTTNQAGESTREFFVYE